MKISRIRIYQSPIKLKEPFVISLGSLHYAENVVVAIDTDQGITGFGECSPFMMINGESMETCFVVARYLAQMLIDKDPLQLGMCSQLMDKVIYANSSIKSAFDIALHDIAAQYAGLPLFAFLGGANNKELTTDYTISIGDKHKMVSDAISIKERGFKIIKVKLGESTEKDIERIVLIRNAIGPDIPLRVDANQGWDTQSAIEILKAIEPYYIQHCEEPVPRWSFMDLPNIRAQSPIPIMADECCCDHHDAERLANLKACDLLNVKLGKSSGIVKAQKIIKIAERVGLKVQVGGFLESRLGFTASAHLALTSPNIVYCDFDTPLMFEEDPVTGGMTYGNHGHIIVPEVPGLGASMDFHYLKKLKSIVISDR